VVASLGTVGLISVLETTVNVDWRAVESDAGRGLQIVPQDDDRLTHLARSGYCLYERGEAHRQAKDRAAATRTVHSVGTLGATREAPAEIILASLTMSARTRGESGLQTFGFLCCLHVFCALQLRPLASLCSVHPAPAGSQRGSKDRSYECPVAFHAGLLEHMPAVAIRMPNGALTSLAGNVDPHHCVAVADLILVQRQVRETVTRLVRKCCLGAARIPIQGAPDENLLTRCE
jgi:hypothetical protein